MGVTTVPPPPPTTSLEAKTVVPLILSLSKDPPSKAPPRPSPAADNLDVTANRRSREGGNLEPIPNSQFLILNS